MTGSDLIYIVMPIVVTLALVILVGLPFAGSRGTTGSHPAGGDPHRPESRDAVASGRGARGEDTRRVTGQPTDGPSGN